MIPVTRSAEPTILKDKELVWLAELDAATTPKAKKTARNRYRQPSVRDALKQLFNRKCAYCESRFAHTSYGHIEHFRPKATFPELTFNWNNLLWACGMCNSAEYKGDRFLEAVDGGPILSPCNDIPGDHLEFVYDDVREEARVVGQTPRGRKTVELLGLNRDDLMDHRTERVETLLVLASLAGKDARAKRLLTQAVGDKAEYAAFARSLLPKVVTTGDSIVLDN